MVTSFSTSATRTENVGRVRSRAFRGKRAGGCSSCWAGCRERSHHPVGADGGRAEKGRTRRCAMLEGGGEEWDRRRGKRRGGGGEGKGEGKGTAPPGWRGEKERGVRRGELPATRSPSIPRWNRRYVPSALYAHGTLAASFLSSLSPLRLSSPFRAHFPVQRVTCMHVHTATMRACTHAHTRACEAHT